ncbi:hypothetical protein EYC80_003722 [Monilinia laxa]|uniref:Uncharacterized protein n=1 Tax=Monilinia laxa TaxID=61186 RepID=A0A5N6KKT6_MONLA|nr:hypothetical protein EYC80_003722 [Monilinia laxa]
MQRYDKILLDSSDRDVLDLSVTAFCPESVGEIYGYGAEKCAISSTFNITCGFGLALEPQLEESKNRRLWRERSSKVQRIPT